MRRVHIPILALAAFALAAGAHAESAGLTTPTDQQEIPAGPPPAEKPRGFAASPAPSPMARHPGATAATDAPPGVPSPPPLEPSPSTTGPNPEPAGAGAVEEATTSAAHRLTKKAELVAEVGWSVMPLPSAGLTAGYYLNPDLVVEANYAKGLLHFVVFKAYSEVLAVRAKKFWGNSFYTNVGLARRTIGAAFTTEAFTGTSLLDQEAEITELTLETSIGNMWQWDNLSLGVDWLGVMWPLTKLSSHDDVPGDLLSRAARERKDEIIDKVAGGRSYEAFRLYIGISL